MTIRTIDESTFEAEVLKSPVPVMLEFGATWCGPCKTLEPVVEQLAKREGEKVRVFKVDADDSAALAAKYKVRGVPTVITFDKGVEHKRHIGTTSLEGLTRLLPAT